MAVRLSAILEGPSLPAGRFLLLISVVESRVILQLKKLSLLKNLITSSKIELATFRLAAYFILRVKERLTLK
jgi:hypothetical protein